MIPKELLLDALREDVEAAPHVWESYRQECLTPKQVVEKIIENASTLGYDSTQHFRRCAVPYVPEP